MAPSQAVVEGLGAVIGQERQGKAELLERKADQLMLARYILLWFGALKGECWGRLSIFALGTTYLNLAFGECLTGSGLLNRYR
jgi:hypothetical protein